MIRVVFDFAIEGIRGREVYWPKEQDPKLAETEAVLRLEERLIKEGLATFECGCCLDVDTAQVELYRIALYQDDTLIMQYPIDVKEG